MGRQWTACGTCEAAGNVSWMWNDKIKGSKKFCMYCQQPWKVVQKSSGGRWRWETSLEVGDSPDDSTGVEHDEVLGALGKVLREQGVAAAEKASAEAFTKK